MAPIGWAICTAETHICVDQTGTFEPIYTFWKTLRYSTLASDRTGLSMLEVINDHTVFVVINGTITASKVQGGNKLVGGAAVSLNTTVTPFYIFAPFITRMMNWR